MYDELLQRLRRYHDNRRTRTIYSEAADVIEQLTADLERSKEWEGFWEEQAEEAKGKLAQYALAVANKPRWIPVTERLPKENGNYLVAINCPRGKWVEICASDGREWVSVDGYAEYATKWVTHWMPLPEPPKEE